MFSPLSLRYSIRGAKLMPDSRTCSAPKMKTCCILVAICCVAIAQASAIEPTTSTADERIRPREWLVIGGVAQFDRAAIHTDAIEAQIVAGTWKPPRAGDVVAMPNGETRTWRSAGTGDDGWVHDPALHAGYAYTAVESDRRRKMLLEVSGHYIVYVNGQPRGGDPYSTGWLRHPIELREGLNHLLFLCRSGGVRAELVSPSRAILFNPRDTTLPDLIKGAKSSSWAAIPIINTTNAALGDLTVESIFAGGSVTQTRVPTIPPMSTRKVGFRIAGSTPSDVDEIDVDLRLLRTSSLGAEAEALDATRLKLRVRSSTQKHKRTFVSDIDGSVQYFAVTPMHGSGDQSGKPSLVLTLHGAGVEAIGQANAYEHKDWAHIVAPTNRRPYGFDWEDWGRWDALEVLAIAERQLGTDPRRIYLTGHSMGGHGTWHLGSLFPDRFAAIAPSAGWISFRSYVNAGDSQAKNRIEHMLRRAASPSDTLSRLQNFAASGIYILHGEKDDNVPVTEARAMRTHLADFHTDFAYYERPGAGHWWDNECVDWPPLFDFLRDHETPETQDVRHLEFATSNPAVSATCHWATIAAQDTPLEISSVNLSVDATDRRISGTTQNVSRLGIDLAKLARKATAEPRDTATFPPSLPVTVRIDAFEIKDVPWPRDGSHLWLEKSGDKWRVIPKPPPALKGPHRYGPFKEAFNRRFAFVYGTRGTREENDWAFAKARFDAETFWYRANGSVDVWADHEFNAETDPDRSVILYGHADSNAAWDVLLSSSPVQVVRNRITVGERELAGGDLACLFVRPRLGSDVALVGVITGTSVEGMRLTNALPYFVSGIGYPDCIVLSKDVLTRGNAGILFAGFFGADWSVVNGDFSSPKPGRDAH